MPASAIGAAPPVEAKRREERVLPKFPRPKHVRGIYLTAWSAGSRRKMDSVLDMLDRTDLNSVVIDVRDAGHVYFRTGIEMADSSGATTVAVVRPEKLMARLSARGVYPIARIACFRDDFLPKKHPELAVKTREGKVWKDRSGHTWLDPYNARNWDYLGSIVDFALDLGFPEVQLDYVRFPSEGKASSMAFPSKATYSKRGATPSQVVAAFAAKMADRVRMKGGVISADIFGIESIGTIDQGIGQSLEIVAAPFDVICPMVYPSHFAKGEYRVPEPNRAPYVIVLKSLKDYSMRLPGKPIRPWLQDFSLRGVTYGKAEVQAQIKAAMQLGYSEFLLWNPLNRYTEAAAKGVDELLKPKPSRLQPRAQISLPGR